MKNAPPPTRTFNPEDFDGEGRRLPPQHLLDNKPKVRTNWLT
jgi:hypothetical protein